jgi:four helix bundle protein
MENKEFGKQMEKRTQKFALSVISLSSLLPFTPEGKVVRNQFTKSGTSIGANYREANRSRSKADFFNKIKICETESNETAYWLEIIIGTNWIENTQTNILLAEANELLAIFTSISSNLR